MFGAFQVLEACMNNCGKRFRSEVAKFRFLNELIKILTPKVRRRTTGLPDDWRSSLPNPDSLVHPFCYFFYLLWQLTLELYVRCCTVNANVLIQAVNSSDVSSRWWETSGKNFLDTP